MDYQVCSLGIWDTTVPGITFDENGVSNYAHFLLSLYRKFPKGEQGQSSWDKYLSAIKEKGKNKQYDCIIGVSGGTDSCYLLHLAKQWGLRPFAVSVDNGFSTQISVENIHKVTKKLGIDFESYTIDENLFKTVATAYMKASLPWIDAPTDRAISTIMQRYAKKYKVNYILNGRDFRSEGKQPFLWTASGTKQMKHITKKFMNSNIKGYPYHNAMQLISLSMFHKIQMLFPFQYVEYDKKSARDLLMTEYDWQYYGEHHHENLYTKFAIAYWLYEKFGIDKRIITYSSQILSEVISRDEALSIVKDKPYDSKTIDSEIEFILKKLNISYFDFQSMMKSENKYIYDYPSGLEFFMKYPATAMWAAKIIFKREPFFLQQLIDDKANSRASESQLK